MDATRENKLLAGPLEINSYIDRLTPQDMNKTLFYAIVLKDADNRESNPSPVFKITPSKVQSQVVTTTQDAGPVGAGTSWFSWNLFRPIIIIVVALTVVILLIRMICKLLPKPGRPKTAVREGEDDVLQIIDGTLPENQQGEDGVPSEKGPTSR